MERSAMTVGGDHTLALLIDNSPHTLYNKTFYHGVLRRGMDGAPIPYYLC